MPLEEKEKNRKFIGASLLCIAAICVIGGDLNNNFTILNFGKITFVVGIIFYFSGRIKRLFIKEL